MSIEATGSNKKTEGTDETGGEGSVKESRGRGGVEGPGWCLGAGVVSRGHGGV